MVVHLYDTAHKAIVPFTPGQNVSIYVCGITPYDSTHLGHANTYLTYDLLIRRLEELGHTVTLVRNITDVDDSILAKARELGVDFLELATTETKRFRNDMANLNIAPAASEPHARQWVNEMISLIATLESNGHIYTVEGATFFDVTTFETFGELSGYTRETMVDLAEQRGGHPQDPRQRNPLDFILWQPSLPDEPEWDSPWGSGRPGWHIECSAMAMGLLGATIDLHGGGSDLIFPHHECERAQSEAASGKPFVRHWMHCGMVAYQGKKMSKSLGNLVFVNELTQKADPRALRLALMSHHYRQDWEWFDHVLQDGIANLELLLTAARSSSGPDPTPFANTLRAALDNDLNAPLAKQQLVNFAKGILQGGDDPQAPLVLSELAELCGIELNTSAKPHA